jgi:hypothetical protein
MNTPRQPNVRPGIADIPGYSRNTNPGNRSSSSFVAPFDANSPPIATSADLTATIWRSEKPLEPR